MPMNQGLTCRFHTTERPEAHPTLNTRNIDISMLSRNLRL